MSPSAPAALAPPPGHPKFPALDALRGLAAVSLLVYHVATASAANQLAGLGWLTSRSDIGVTLFFVLSGFLVYRPFVAAGEGLRRRVRPRDFYRRRVLRIVPAYWLALFLAGALPLFANLGPPYKAILSGDWYVYFGFLQTYSGETSAQGFAHAWTLCVEVAFYAVLPLFAWMMARSIGLRGAAIYVLAGLALASILFRAYTHLNLASHVVVPWLSLTLPATFGWFAIGMAMAVWSVRDEGGAEIPKPIRFLRDNAAGALTLASIGFLALAGLGGLPRGPEQPFSDLGWTLEHVGYGACCALVIVPFVWVGNSGWTQRVMRWRALAWLGLISYGLYLWHVPVLLVLVDRGGADVFAGSPFISLAVLTFVVTCAVAAASYYLVERPILRFKDRQTRGSRHAHVLLSGTAHCPDR